MRKPLVFTSAVLLLFALTAILFGTENGLVLVRQPSGTYTVNLTGLAAVANAPDTIGKTIIIPTLQTVTANLTLHSDRSLEFWQGGRITTASGFLNISSPTRIGNHQAFSGTGVRFHGRSVTTVSPLWWGAIGDFNQATLAGTDNTGPFTAAIVAAGGKIPVTVPPGDFKFTGSLPIYPGLQITGSTKYSADSRSALGTSTTLSLMTSTEKPLFRSITSAGRMKFGYLWGVNLSAMSLRNGNPAVRIGTGLDLNHIASSKFENLSLTGFTKGVDVNYGMRNTFNDLNILGSATAFNIGAGGVTTTQTINQGMFRQSDWGFVAESDRSTGYSIGTICNNCIIEATLVGGINMHKGSGATFDKLYMEAVPDDRVEVGGRTDGSAIRLFFDGTPQYASESKFNLTNSLIAGGNSARWKKNTAIEIDAAAKVNINNTHITRYAKGITWTTNTQKRAVETYGLSFIGMGTSPLFLSTPLDAKFSGTMPTAMITDPNLSQYAQFGNVSARSLELGDSSFISTNSKIITGRGKKINIPITYQTQSNYKHKIRISGIDGAPNTAVPYGFFAEFACGSLTTISNLTTLDSAGITSVSISGMTLVVTLPQSMKNPLVKIEIMSQNATLFDLAAITIE